MARPVFRAHPNITFGEINEETSQTVPDQSISIKEILYRFTKGLPLDEYEVPLYTGSDDEQNDDNFDIHPANSFGDLPDMILENSEKLEAAQRNYEKAIEDAKRDELNDANKSEVAVE